MSKPFLSIIIPAHNEAQRLGSTLKQVQEFVQTQNYEIEVLIIENGSTDSTAQLAGNWLARFPQLQLISLKEPGKGRAVQKGMLQAKGQYRFMADADLSMPIDEIRKFIPPALNDKAIAISSRELPGAKRIGEPVQRHWVGRVFNLLVRLLVLPGLHDSQCGFKCFSAEAAENIFPRQALMGWSFDVEVLAIARQLGYEITEVPITWIHHHGSRVKVLHDSWRMARDLWQIRTNIKKGLYLGKTL